MVGTTALVGAGVLDELGSGRHPGAASCRIGIVVTAEFASAADDQGGEDHQAGADDDQDTGQENAVIDAEAAPTQVSRARPSGRRSP